MLSNPISPILWDECDLGGLWEVTLKLDGVRAFINEDGAVSRSGKPLYHLEKYCQKGMTPRDVEVYTGSFKDTISRIRTIVGSDIEPQHLYDLYPLDKRLHICYIENPLKNGIKAILKIKVSEGYEGLVLRQNNVWLKVKPYETYDIKVIDIQEGKGKNKGRLGAFVTSRGNVGTGLTDEERILYFNKAILGMIIEVECMHLTENGMFRLPRFKRLRLDKC